MRLMLFAILLAGAVGASAATYTVNSAADTNDGVCDAASCTLREAITVANAAGGGTIHFAIGSGPAGITLLSALPDLTTPIVIDGTTQPGYAGTPLIQLTGFSSGANCLVLRASDSAVRGLDIGLCVDGITVLSNAGTAIRNIAIERNFIGTRLATATINNRAISLSATGTSTLSNVTIGNGSAAGRNVLATFGFVADALAISGNTSDVTVAGNYVGVGDAGTALQTVSRFTTDIGIYGSASSNNILIGGSTAGARNVLASGGGTQVHFKIDSSGSNLSIEGNYIGTDPTGTTRMAASNFGVWFFGQGSATIRNNVMASASGNAISTGVSGRNITIQGNWIGVKADASGPFPFAATTAILDFGNAAPLVIGGPNPGDGNVIANYFTGILVSTPGALIQGNRFGLDPTGTTIFGSGTRGVACSFVQAEPPVLIRDNAISSFAAGIEIGNQGRATIENNLIGTDATGTVALPNTNGISIIGGAGRTRINSNVVSGNTANGILVSATTMPVDVTGNRIGLSAVDAPLPNGGDGIRIAAGTGPKNIGFLAGAPNTIANNGGNGVSVVAGSPASILGNSIFDNAGLAIDLDTAGVTPNDAGDADTGANGLQNTPVLLSATIVAAGTSVEGSLNSTASGTFTIELFANTVADPSAHGEAKTFLTRFNVSTDAGGNALFSTVAPLMAPGTILSATATNAATFETSELSNDVPVVSGGALQFSAAVTTVNESAGTVTITVTRTGSGSVPATVQYASNDGSATAGSDYTAVAGTLNFAAADASKTFDVPIAGDSLDEPDETFTLTLSNVTGGALGTPINATVTIGDDDAMPALIVLDASLIEGDSGTGTLSFNVQLSAASARTITVDYSTTDQTANAGPDYGQRFGTLTYAPGETSKPVAVIVNGETVAEADETLRLLLTSPSNATIAVSEGIGTIANDDALPAISIGDVTVVEGNAGASTATLTLTLSNPGSAVVSANWATNANSATGSDFNTASGVVTFNPGVTTLTIDVTVNGDTVVEPLEQFEVNLTNPSGGTVADARGLVRIADDDGEPSLTINSVAVSESAGSAALTVLLAPASAQTVSVVYDLTDGSATAGSDYTDGSATLTFAPGATTQTFNVAIQSDNVAEGAETVGVSLSVPANAAIANGTATVTIVDDDGAPNASIDDVNVVEGNAGTALATFTVIVSNPSASVVMLNWSAAAGTASAGSDFTGASGILTFNPGETSKPVTVLVNGDALDEPDETFFVALSGASNAVITRTHGTATIVNDDGTPALVISDATLTEGNAGTAMMSFVVTLAGNTAQTVSADYAVAGGTAVANSDYAPVAGRLTFVPGVTTQTIAVPVVGDLSVEADETLFVNLFAPVQAMISDNQALGTIVDDDIAAIVPSVAIGNASIVEGNAGTSTAVFTVSLSQPTTMLVTVDYATSNGSAGAGSDYSATSGTLVFAPGMTTRAINVAVAGDTTVEPDESFLVDLSNAVGATVADARATGVILNDDSATVVPSFSIEGVRVTEGDVGTRPAVFAVTLSAPAATPVTVEYATRNGSADSGSDYVASSGALVFSPGTTLRSVTVAILGDTLDESSETFTLRLSNPSGATIADGQATGTIADDDETVALPSLSIDDTAVTEGNSGATPSTFVVRLSNASTLSVMVGYRTEEGTAASGADYAASSGTLVFAPGEISQQILVPVVGDTAMEPDETFSLVLTDPAGATLAAGHATATIRDDDGASGTAVLVIAGSGPGVNGAFYRTALQLLNPGEDAMTGNLIVRPIGGGAEQTFGYALLPREARTLTELDTLSGFSSIDLVPLTGSLPNASMRVYNDAGAGGTSGFATELIAASEALTSGQRAALLAPANASAMRYNIGVRALGKGASITFTLRRASGAPAAQVSRTFASNVLMQTAAASFFGMALQDDDWIELTITDGSAVVFGSSIDNVTQDSAFSIAKRVR